MTGRRCSGALLAAALLLALGCRPSPERRAHAQPPQQPADEAPWRRTGHGNAVFDLPADVTRLRITGTWSGRNFSNFVVRVSGRTVVNEILADTKTYTGVHRTSGVEVEIVDAAEIAWVFEAIRP